MPRSDVVWKATITVHSGEYNARCHRTPGPVVPHCHGVLWVCPVPYRLMRSYAGAILPMPLRASSRPSLRASSAEVIISPVGVPRRHHLQWRVGDAGWALTTTTRRHHGVTNRPYPRARPFLIPPCRYGFGFLPQSTAARREGKTDICRASADARTPTARGYRQE